MRFYLSQWWLRILPLLRCYNTRCVSFQNWPEGGPGFSAKDPGGDHDPKEPLLLTLPVLVAEWSPCSYYYAGCQWRQWQKLWLTRQMLRVVGNFIIEHATVCSPSAITLPCLKFWLLGWESWGLILVLGCSYTQNSFSHVLTFLGKQMTFFFALKWRE